MFIQRTLQIRAFVAGPKIMLFILGHEPHAVTTFPHSIRSQTSGPKKFFQPKTPEIRCSFVSWQLKKITQRQSVEKIIYMLILSFKFGYNVWRSHETRYRLCGKFFNHSDCQITMGEWLRSIPGLKPMGRKYLFSFKLAFSSTLSLYLHISPTRRQLNTMFGLSSVELV